MNKSHALPWYQRTLRWGQTNLSEHDPLTYDHAFWREYWQHTCTQGIIVNAGGIVAYYPSRFTLQHRAAHLGERDLFGEIVTAAREAGLAVVARMDSNRASEAFHQAHPDWFTLDAKGQPGMAGGRYIACINSPYTRQYLPEVLREIIERYHPDGFADNSWTGANRGFICHCTHCQEKFHTAADFDLPVQADWDDPAYRAWIRWSYACRTDVWDLNNQITRSAGGRDCLWLGMVHGNPFASHLSGCDLNAIGTRADMLLNDQQSRDSHGFEQNTQSGKLLHELTGWDKLIPESMSMYVRGEQAFRKGSAPPLEARKWMVTGFAGGISPWWHHVGAEQEDRRQFHTAEPLMRWHADNQEYLYQRQPVATIGVVWSYDNIDFFGRDQSEQRTAEPWRGITLALSKARLPYLPLHAGHIARAAPQLDVLVLPNLGAMAASECQAVRDFVEAGGSLVATGCTSLLDEDGRPRPGELTLGELLGVQFDDQQLGLEREVSSNWEVYQGHNYLRLPATGLMRHPLLEGFEETDLIPFGGTLQKVQALPGSKGVATYVPSFPIYPPETSWMRQPSSDQPAIVARPHPAGGRIVYFAADIDRCYGRRGLPDHARLLANAVRWAGHDRFPLHVEGPGFVDCSLYRQPGRLILHLVNLSGCNAWGYLEEHLPVGPLRVTLQLDPGWCPRNALRRVIPEALDFTVQGDKVVFVIPQLVDHELVIIE